MAMSDIGRVSPNVNASEHQPVGSMLSSFGINVSGVPIEVPARVLPKPGVIYSSKTAHVNNHAQWDFGDARFVVGAQLDYWVVFVIKDGYRNSRSEFTGVTDSELREAVKAFRDMCNCKGMDITADPTYTAVQLPPPSVDGPMGKDARIAAIRTGLLRNKPKPQAVLVVLANGDQLVYEGVKYLCDVILDVTTLCVLPAKFRAARLQYLSSLSLKLNMKLGGINHRIDGESMVWLHAAPTMVVGMDVVHPEPGCVMGTRE